MKQGGQLFSAGYKIILDDRLTLIQASKTFLEMAGLEISALYKEIYSLKELLASEEFEHMHGSLNYQPDGEQTFSFRQKLKGRDREYDVINSGTLFRAETGEIFFSGVLSDITKNEGVKEEFFELLENIDIGIVKIRADREGTILYCNTAFCSMFGYTPEEIRIDLKNSIKAIVKTENYKMILGDYADAGSRSKAKEMELAHKDGKLFRAAVWGKPVMGKNGEIYVAASFSDISSFFSERQLYKSRKDWIAVWESLSEDYIFEYDYKNDVLIIPQIGSSQTNGERYIKNYVKNMSRYGNIYQEDQKGFIYNVIESPVTEGRVMTYEFRSRLLTGQYEWYRFYYTTFYDDICNEKRLFGRLVNINNEKQNYDFSKNYTAADIRSGLFSPDSFSKTVDYYLREEGKLGNHALLKINIHNFTAVVEKFGYLFADSLMEGVAVTIKRLINPADLLSQISDDVFLLFLKNITKKQVLEKSSEIQKSLDKDFLMGLLEFSINSKIGITCYPSDGKTTKELSNKTDIALQYVYSEKETGYAFYSDIKSDDTYSQPENDSKQMVKKKGWDYDRVLLTYALQIISMSRNLTKSLEIIMDNISKRFNLDTVVIVLKEQNSEKSSIFYVWKNPEGMNSDFTKKKFKNSQFDCFYEKEIQVVNNCPQFKNGARDFWDLFHTQAALHFNFSNQKEADGFFCYMDIKKPRIWTKVEIDTLKEVTSLLVPIICINLEKQEEKRLLLETAAAADEANKSKSQFLSHMSHEMRTPLNGIIGMAAIAKESAGDMEKVQDCVYNIENSASYLLKIVNDVLDMAKMETGELFLTYELFYLKDFLCEVHDTIMKKAGQKQIGFKVNNYAGDYLINGDKKRLNEIIYNILSNAVKFTPSGGKVGLAVNKIYNDRQEVILRFQISDTGIGMDEEFQKHIFEPFTQKESGNTAKDAGTGLGLAICKNIADLMHGVIQVKSEPQKGSTFIVEVPLKLGSMTEEREPDDNEIRKTDEKKQTYLEFLKGKRILLAEDNTLNLEIAQTILEMNGMLVESAQNGEAAVKMFLASPPGYYDAILMDIHMPVLNGLQATVKIRCSQKEDAKAIIIIAMTANSFQNDITCSLSCGMNDHLSKPINVEQFIQTLYKNLYAKKKQLE